MEQVVTAGGRLPQPFRSGVAANQESRNRGPQGCAQAVDGKLLLFEADIAMIVHSMDSPAIYPYKVPQMRAVFAAFCAMLKQRAASRPARSVGSAA